MKIRLLVTLFAVVVGMLLALSTVQSSNASMPDNCEVQNCPGSGKLCCKSGEVTFFKKMPIKGEEEEEEEEDPFLPAD